MEELQKLSISATNEAFHWEYYKSWVHVLLIFIHLMIYHSAYSMETTVEKDKKK